MPEPVKLKHVSTKENVNEVWSSASPQKRELRSPEAALTKKTTERAG